MREHKENRPLGKPSRCKWDNDIKMDVKERNGVAGFVWFSTGAGICDIGIELSDSINYRLFL